MNTNNDRKGTKRRKEITTFVMRIFLWGGIIFLTPPISSENLTKQGSPRLNTAANTARNTIWVLDLMGLTRRYKSTCEPRGWAQKTYTYHCIFSLINQWTGQTCNWEAFGNRACPGRINGSIMAEGDSGDMFASLTIRCIHVLFSYCPPHLSLQSRGLCQFH